MTDFATSSRGDRVAYDQWGAGPGLIFVAGAGPHRATDPWTTETAQLAGEQGVTAIVFDRLGRGESHVSGRLGLDRELAAIAALVDVAGGRAVLCGHSSGGSIALAAAARGLSVDGLALWETPLGGTADTRAWVDEVERRIDVGDLEGALVHYMKDMPPEWLAEAKKSPGYGEMVAQVVSYLADGQSLAWVDSVPLAEALAGVRVPVIAMYGTETFPEMHRSAAAIVEAVPGAIEKEMPGSGHAWEPHAMATELAAFAVEVAQ